MSQNEMLDRMCALETFQEILEALTPRQLMLVARRLDLPNYWAVADELGLAHGLVSTHLTAARRRIVERMPELAPEIEGRKLGTGFKIRSRKRVQRTVQDR